MYVTNRHICFYASLPGKKVKYCMIFYFDTSANYFVYVRKVLIKLVIYRKRIISLLHVPIDIILNFEIMSYHGILLLKQNIRHWIVLTWNVSRKLNLRNSKSSVFVWLPINITIIPSLPTLNCRNASGWMNYGKACLWHSMPVTAFESFCPFPRSRAWINPRYFSLLPILRLNSRKILANQALEKM